MIYRAALIKRNLKWNDKTLDDTQKGNTLLAEGRKPGYYRSELRDFIIKTVPRRTEKGKLQKSDLNQYTCI